MSGIHYNVLFSGLTFVNTVCVPKTGVPWNRRIKKNIVIFLCELNTKKNKVVRLFIDQFSFTRRIWGYSAVVEGEKCYPQLWTCVTHVCYHWKHDRLYILHTSLLQMFGWVFHVRNEKKNRWNLSELSQFAKFSLFKITFGVSNIYAGFMTTTPVLGSAIKPTILWISRKLIHYSR